MLGSAGGAAACMNSSRPIIVPGVFSMSGGAVVSLSGVELQTVGALYRVVLRAAALSGVGLLLQWRIVSRVTGRQRCSAASSTEPECSIPPHRADHRSPDRHVRPSFGASHVCAERGHRPSDMRLSQRGIRGSATPGSSRSVFGPGGVRERARNGRPCRRRGCHPRPLAGRAGVLSAAPFTHPGETSSRNRLLVCR